MATSSSVRDSDIMYTSALVSQARTRTCRLRHTPKGLESRFNPQSL